MLSLWWQYVIVVVTVCYQRGFQNFRKTQAFFEREREREREREQILKKCIIDIYTSGPQSDIPKNKNVTTQYTFIKGFWI